jgi:hypothetical protein
MPKVNRFRVNPKAETAPQIKSGRVCSYRYAYARSADSRAADETGQDYLTFSESTSLFAFALCDGVSQSFFGDIAARILGDGLLKWLEGLPAGGISIPSEALSGFLGELTTRATSWVQQYPIPEEIAPMLLEVLEEKRELGSEATFICGRIDLPSASLPQGRLLLAWMGDSRLRFWGPVGERSAELGDEFHTNQRWSTRRGPVNGKPHLFQTALASEGRLLEVVRVLTYSDGLASLDDQSEAPTNFALQEMIVRAAESATSDDISLLEIWLGIEPDRISAQPLPTVQRLEVEVEQNHLMASWSALPGAQKYQVQVRWEDQSLSWETTGAPWRSEHLSPGLYRVRVRALDTLGVPGRWSAECEIEIRAPVEEEPPPAPTVTVPSLASTTVPALGRERRRSPVIGQMMVGLLLGAAGLIFGLVSGVIPIPGRGSTATPTATWTVAITEVPLVPADTATPLPTVPPSPTKTATQTLAPTWTLTPSSTPAVSSTPTLSVTAAFSPTTALPLTPMATELISVLPTPSVNGTELSSPLATPEGAP